MSGLYADPPYPRLAYDRDGTVLLNVRDSGVITQVSGVNTGILGIWNNENADYGSYQVGYGTYGFEIPGDTRICLIFPTPRTILGWRFQWVSRVFNGFDWSPNTTNGLDGTWNGLTNPTASGSSKGDLRSGITAAPAGLTNVKALRLRGDGAVYYTQIGVMHLYGHPTSLTDDRLVFWHPTLDQPLRQTPAFLDYGDRQRDSTITRTVRVKNVSSALTAVTPQISTQVLSEALAPAPTIVSQNQFSFGGGAFAQSINIPSLAPGAISGDISVRLAVAPDAEMGVHTIRYVAEATNWT